MCEKDDYFDYQENNYQVRIKSLKNTKKDKNKLKKIKIKIKLMKIM